MNPTQMRRAIAGLHVIVGDANMSEYITALKVGTTALVIDLIEAGCLPNYRLKDPIAAMKNVARDQTYAWLVEVEGSGSRLVPAVEIQDAFLALARREFAGRDRETDWVLSAWDDVLEKLGRDPMDLVGVCDWVTKKWLIDSFCEAENLAWDNPDDLFWMQSQDLEYSNVDRDAGLYYLLESQGQMVRLVGDDEVAAAMSEPPSGTRAYFRGRSLEKFGDYVSSINWDRIVFKRNGRQHPVDMKLLVDVDRVQRYNEVLDRAETLEDFLAALEKVNP